MTEIYDLFPATQRAARVALDAFLLHAGARYAQGRNFDYGPGAHDNVSVLSPYVRLRVLDEIDITRAVLSQHSAAEAGKFLTEVFWRTYWKGWMELRPSVWDQYLNDIKSLQDKVQTQSGLRSRWEDACLGKTGIAPFDVWAQELVSTGYLHNHARMWFASIWIFTLDLPWQLGADFFLRHLLDGDAAVNTLSWRWVAGIQTQGKTYLATQENIAKFTDGRFAQVPGLARTAPPRAAPPKPQIGVLPPVPPLSVKSRYGLLLHSDDVDLHHLLDHAPDPVSIAYLDATPDQTPWMMAPYVSDFRRKMVEDMCMGYQTPHPIKTAAALQDWAASHNVDQIITPYAPVGTQQKVLAEYRNLADVPRLDVVRRPLDSTAWPLATKGFFPFRKHIPDLITEFAMK